MLKETGSLLDGMGLEQTVILWLDAIRNQQDVVLLEPVAVQFVQLVNGSPSVQTVETLLQTGCKQLATEAPKLAELLTLYYWQRLSIQAIKNNRQYSESVPTLWRQLKKGVAQLTTMMQRWEVEARRHWREALYETLPMLPYDRVFGRTPAIQTLTTQLCTENQWLINLVGLGGLGKSTLAHAAIKQLIAADQIHYLCWIQLEHDHKDASPDAFLNTLIAQLHTNLLNRNVAAINRRERLRQLRQHLQSQPTLIVIDNVDALVDDGTLSEQLYTLANPSRFLLISRTRLVTQQPVRLIKLRSLEKQAALAFVRDRAQKLGVQGIEANEALERLYAIVGGHPQALRLFVTLAHYFSAETILEEFESAETRDIATFYNTIYQRIWERQSNHARRLLDAMRLLPAYGADAAYLTAFCGLNKSEQWEAIRELSDAALLERTHQAEKSHYFIHHLTDAFLNVIQPTRTDIAREWFTEQLVAACRYWQPKIDNHESFQRFQPHLIKLTRLGILNPASWQSVVELMLTLYFQIENSLFWQEWLPLFQLALEHAQPETHQLQYRLYSRFATLHHIQHDYATAATMHHHALMLADSLDNLKGVGREHVHLCIAYRYLGKHQAAAQHGQTALDIFEELHLTPHFQVVALNSLGQNALAETDFERANRFFAKAITVATANVPAVTRAKIHANWGDTLRLLGKRSAAYDHYQVAQHLNGHESGKLNQLLLDAALCHLHLDEGRLVDAQQIVGQPTFNYQMDALPVLHRAHIADAIGRFHLLSNNLSAAIDALGNARQLWQETQFVRRVGLASTYLARAYYLAGDLENAVQCARATDVIFDSADLTRWREIYQIDHKLLLNGFTKTEQSVGSD